MSDVEMVPAEAEVVEAPAIPGPDDCPVTAERLPPQHRRYVDFKGPAMGRVMAAKGLVPLQPPDMAHVLYMLTFDLDEKVRAQVATTLAEEKTRKLMQTALRDESLEPMVLDYFAQQYVVHDALIEVVLANASTDDNTIAWCASQVSNRIAEAIAQNQLRLLRQTEILRHLCANTNASQATIDLACDFAVRSGVVMDDVQSMYDARIRIHGPDAPPPEPEVSVEEIIEATGGTADEEAMAAAEGAAPAAPLEEGKRLSLVQKIMKLNVAQKIKLATLGNKEARTLLLRETNKLVAMAAIKSPRITDGEVFGMAQSKTCQEDVLRYIYSSRAWTKNQKIRLALIKNPKVPGAISMKFLGTLRESELKDLIGDRNVPALIQQTAKRMTEKKKAPDEGH